MATKEQSVTLLRRNKRAQVAALRAGGFSVTEDSRAADFAKYVRWGNGLLDVTIYAARISDGQAFYFTKEEWGELSLAERNLFVRGGVRVRSHGMSIIIAAIDPTESLATWPNASSYCASYKAFTAEADGVDDPNTWRLPNIEAMKQIYRHFDLINEVFVAGWSSDYSLQKYRYWTSEQNGASNSWVFRVMYSGDLISSEGNGNNLRFRPVVIQNV